MAFKDNAHASDHIAAGLSQDSSGACKGPSSPAQTCVEASAVKLCGYCKAKRTPTN